MAATRSRALIFGVLGVCLEGFLGIAVGLARRSASALVVAGLVGSILGLALAAGASFAVLSFFLKTQPVHLFIALGTANRADRLEIRWPSGASQPWS